MPSPGVSIVNGKVVPTGDTKSLRQLNAERLEEMANAILNPPEPVWDPFSGSQQYILNEILDLDPNKYYMKNPKGGWNEVSADTPGRSVGWEVQQWLMKAYGLYDPRSDPNNPKFINLSNLVELPHDPQSRYSGQPSNVGPLRKRWGYKGTRPGKNSGWVVGPDGKGRWVEDISTLNNPPETGKKPPMNITFNGRTATAPTTTPQTPNNYFGSGQGGTGASTTTSPNEVVWPKNSETYLGRTRGPGGVPIAPPPTTTQMPNWWGVGGQNNPTLASNQAAPGKGIQMPSWWKPQKQRSKNFTRQWMPKKLY